MQIIFANISCRLLFYKITFPLSNKKCVASKDLNSHIIFKEKKTLKTYLYHYNTLSKIAFISVSFKKKMLPSFVSTFVIFYYKCYAYLSSYVRYKKNFSCFPYFFHVFSFRFFLQIYFFNRKQKAFFRLRNEGKKLKRL